MTTITTKSHVGGDGLLKLEVPTGLVDIDCQVTVTIQPIHATENGRTPEELGWPPGFFEETFGSLRHSPLIREPQGEYEVRDELK